MIPSWLEVNCVQLIVYGRSAHTIPTGDRIHFRSRLPPGLCHNAGLRIVWPTPVRVTPCSAIGAEPLRVISIRFRRAQAQQRANWMLGPIRSGVTSRLFPGIAIDLQDTAEALQYPFGMLPAPTGRIDEGHTR